MEFATVFGMCCIDQKFRDALLEKINVNGVIEEPISDTRNKITIPPDVMLPVHEFIKAEGFHLSRWEIGELIRVMSIPEVPIVMKALYRWGWCGFCAVGRSYYADYTHEDTDSTKVVRSRRDLVQNRYHIARVVEDVSGGNPDSVTPPA